MPIKTLRKIKHYVRSSRPYVVVSEINAVLKKHLKTTSNTKTFSLKPKGTPHGDILFSYVTHAFSGKPIPYTHSSYWESRQMAETFVDLGYSVDVISGTDAAGFTPKKNYACFIGHRHNFDRIASRLNTDCIKVLHCDVAHWLFHNTAGSLRLLALQQRRGITLPFLRLQDANQAIEQADCATVLGNEFTASTYRYAQKPIYRVPISTPSVYPWPTAKRFDTCRRNFLWFNSNGFVHKGLDLVLEAFASMPQYHLTICGPLKDKVEQPFERAYHKELYETPNISTAGWIEDGSPEFLRIVNNCIAVISASCSEGGGGSVLSCLHAGLIPIVSYESSVDVGAFGLLLEDCSVGSIQESVRTIASLPAENLESRARQAWEFARANHTREKFAEEYRAVARTILRTLGRSADSVESRIEHAIHVN